MRIVAPLAIAALLAASTAAVEFNPHVPSGVSPLGARRHISHAKMRRQAAGKQWKRCKPKTSTSASSNPAPVTSSSGTSSAAAPAPTKYSSTGNNNGGSSGGVINVKTSGCGNIGATPQTTHEAGPNGSENWLNCGVGNGGWNPPFVTVADLKYKDLTGVLNSGNSIFKPCQPYLDIIYGAAQKNRLPPILISSIMMQESTCNKDTVGGGGEQGLMQITKDKCGGAPNGDCKDPYFNINTGAKYLADQINNYGGNVLQAVGSYNGWVQGLTYQQATAARYSSCCRCQNNLDYLHQFFNGWLQNIDAYSSDLGTYKNLDVCH